jgi:hypothetical protein
MAFGEPDDYGPEKDEQSSDDWYERPTKTTVFEVEPEPDD